MFRNILLLSLLFCSLYAIPTQALSFVPPETVVCEKVLKNTTWDDIEEWMISIEVENVTSVLATYKDADGNWNGTDRDISLLAWNYGRQDCCQLHKNPDICREEIEAVAKSQMKAFREWDQQGRDSLEAYYWRKKIENSPIGPLLSLMNSDNEMSKKMRNSKFGLALPYVFKAGLFILFIGLVLLAVPRTQKYSLWVLSIAHAFLTISLLLWLWFRFF